MKAKLIFAGAGLFGLGAAWGWAWATDKAEEKLKQAEENADSYSALLREKTIQIARLEAELDDFKDAEAVQMAEEVNSGGQIDDIAEETEEETRQNLQNIINDYTSNPDDRDEFVERGTRVAQDRDTMPGPYVISRGEYSDGEEGNDFAKVTITWYPRERMLLDEDETPIHSREVDGLVGYKNLNSFGGESGDPNVVFIRNRRIEVDYEVVRELDNPVPVHVKYGMPKAEFDTNVAAGLIKFRREDMGD